MGEQGPDVALSQNNGHQSISAPVLLRLGVNQRRRMSRTAVNPQNASAGSTLLSISIRPDAPNGVAEKSGHVDNLTRLGSRNYSVKVRVFAFGDALLAFSRTLDPTLLLLLLLLSAGSFSLTFIHAFCLRA
jgi:hypothetical protein